MRAAVAAAQVCLLQQGFLRQQEALEAPAVEVACDDAIRPFPPAGVEATGSFCQISGKLLSFNTIDREPLGAHCGDIWIKQPPCCDALKQAAEQQCGMGAVTDAVECVMDTRVWTGGGTDVGAALLKHDMTGVMVEDPGVPVETKQFEFAGASLLCSLFSFEDTLAPTPPPTPAPTVASGTKGHDLPLWRPRGAVAGADPSISPYQADAHQTTTQSLHKPSGIAFNNETLYVADTYNHRVVRFDPGSTDGTVVAGNHGAGKELNQLWNPVGLAVDPSEGGTLYAACLRSGSVRKWVAGRDAGEVVIDGLFHPHGLALMPGVLFVSDVGEHQVVRFALATGEKTVVAGEGGEGKGLGQFRGPQGLAVDGQGNLFVADSQNHRVLKFAPGQKEGVVVAGTGEPGQSLKELHTPTGVAVDGAGTVLVVEDGNTRVTAWPPGAAEGVLLAGGTQGDGPSQLARHPADIKLDPEGALFVADRDNNRVVKWST